MIDSRIPDHFEWRFELVTMGILLLGVISIYSATHDLDKAGHLPMYAQQMIWILVGMLSFLVAMAIDYHRLASQADLIYGLTLVMLVLVLMGGRSSRGAQRWFSLGPV